MVSKRRNRRRRPARRPRSRSPKRRFLVVCEGEVTEPAYINGYVRWTRSATVEVEIPKEHGVPLTLVREAKQRKDDAQREARSAKDDFLAYDEVWCVFDIDDHPKLNEAIQLAEANGIELAVSNPCFELWLLLHFRDNPGMQHRNKVQRMLRKHLTNYDKHLDFDHVAQGISDACVRAKHLDDEAQEVGEAGRNPTTGVYRLVQSIARK